ncbi:hypothetical protein ACIQ7D_06860 [Streptomyces sp. NPDC096310]|uniref:hypothetical protein n=1 Tax=Streptomyces sp. NPDC096310 TaxID=3366082 RepID=UPI00381CB9FC
MGDTGADRDSRESEDGRESEGSRESAEERELRVLLERVAPRLSGPEDRLARVRERVVRGRRRRRTAGAAGAAVAGLVLAGALLPGVVRGGPERVLPAATVPGPVPTADLSPSTARDRSGETPAPDGAWVSFTHLRGLTLRPPSGWYTLDLPPDGESGVAARSFVSSRPLTPDDRSCPAGQRYDCPPLRTLGPDGALVTLVAQGADTPPGTPPSPPPYPSPETVGSPSGLRQLEKLSAGCRRIGGTREYSVLLDGTSAASDSPTLTPGRDRSGASGSPGPTPAVPVTPVAAVGLCVAGDAPGTVEAVHTMITGADFDAGTASSSAPPPFLRNTK